jgi:hypothetical protein
MTMERSYERVMKARDAILAQFKANGLGASKIRCPVCDRGVLSYKIYVNNRGSRGTLRIHAKCDVFECVEWLE